MGKIAASNHTQTKKYEFCSYISGIIHLYLFWQLQGLMCFDGMTSVLISIHCAQGQHNMLLFLGGKIYYHYNDVLISSLASQITSLTIVYSNVYSGADQRKHQSSASLDFVWGIHRWLMNSPHKGPVTRKMFPFDDVIMIWGLHWQRETRIHQIGINWSPPGQNGRHFADSNACSWMENFV